MPPLFGLPTRLSNSALSATRMSLLPRALPAPTRVSTSASLWRLFQTRKRLYSDNSSSAAGSEQEKETAVGLWPNQKSSDPFTPLITAMCEVQDPKTGNPHKLITWLPNVDSFRTGAPSQAWVGTFIGDTGVQNSRITAETFAINLDFRKFYIKSVAKYYPTHSGVLARAAMIDNGYLLVVDPRVYRLDEESIGIEFEDPRFCEWLLEDQEHTIGMFPVKNKKVVADKFAPFEGYRMVPKDQDTFGGAQISTWLSKKMQSDLMEFIPE
eukprot:TRINITY_DN15330_c0_g1_i1.p1 TRINITY_DN15330_c0_g1~~TRINITY_DN15330_c0_g1_i1.p1  ORF type:complete len:268 (-),score=39.79 TRINITY_DN15330_c0_g1_i1:40-843(-)